MKTINIAFLAFWPGFDIHNNNFIDILRLKYNVNVIEHITDAKQLDLLIYSCFYMNNTEKDFIYHLNCKKLYYSGENDFPNFNVCDYAITHNKFEFDHRHIYCPNWLFGRIRVNQDGNLYTDLNTIGSNDKALLKRKFCSFVVSNNYCAIPIREKIFNEISKYKQVDSGGKHLNNIGGPVADKQGFISQYKFNIAAENSITSGYITEKIVDAFNANTIPIYAGPMDVTDEFNSEAFINLNNFSSFDDLRKYIERVDTDDNLYMEMLSASKYNNDIIYNLISKLRSFLYFVIEDKRQFTHKYGRIGLMLRNNNF